MKKIKLLIIIFLTTINAIGQNISSPKYEHHFKKPKNISTDEYDISFFDIESQAEFCKMAVKIFNKTNDFLIFDMGAPIFNFDFGKFSDKKKKVIIEPNSNKRKTLQVSGTNKFQVQSFNLSFNGISLLSSEGNISKMANFQVPASKNSIQTNAFKLNLKKSSLRTQEAALIFECIYQGDNIGIVNPSKLSVKVDGTDLEYANDIKNPNPKLLFKGDKLKIKAVFHIPGRIADMQFANMTILWNDSFRETNAQKLKGHEITFNIDRGMTNGKN